MQEVQVPYTLWLKLYYVNRGSCPSMVAKPSSFDYSQLEVL